MTSIVKDIQAVRSLREDLRDLKLPSNILNSIETIHNCIKSGTDPNGWKKVDWRSNGSKAVNSGGGYHRGSSGGGSGGNSFFGNRGKSSHYSNDTSHQAFNSRPRQSYSTPQRPSTEQATSIPLTSSTDETVKQTSSTPVTHVSHVSSDGFRTPPQKYVSKFKKSSEKVEDTILNTIILGKLNKFSELNYDEIKEFITHIIDSGQTDMIKCFMKLVFEKAASEEMFCPLYAKLLSELSIRYPVLLTEMANLYSVYMEIFDEVVEQNAENYNEVCKRNVEKKYRRGYSQFLAELIKHNVIDSTVFMKTVTKIIGQVELNIKKKEAIKLVEEYADCIMKIMKAIQNDNASSDDTSSDDTSSDSGSKISKYEVVENIRQTLKNTLSKTIQPLTVRNPENIGLSNKARFTFLDIYENINTF